MTKPATFEEIAAREAVTFCSGLECPIPKAVHDVGRANVSSGIVHWTPRRVTKAGMRRFLMLVASIYRSHNRGQPRWVQLYEQNVFASRRALSEYHVRLPRHLSLTDRAKARFALAQQGVLNDPEWSQIAKWSQER